MDKRGGQTLQFISGHNIIHVCQEFTEIQPKNDDFNYSKLNLTFDRENNIKASRPIVLLRLFDNHLNCPQAKYQRVQAVQSQQGSHVKSYADVVGNRQHRYNIPTKNFFAPLNY